MEASAIDELYGELDQEHGDAALNYDEESVDIYSGLEDSPRSHGENGKSSAFPSPLRLKESMDLYEELITKEQEEKEATYNELKSKFEAAQNRVQELLAKLQQMQTQNSSLHKENILLKKNICALIKTARMEIVRKDEQISKLSKRSGRGIFHIPALEMSPASINHGLNSRRSQDLKGGWSFKSSQRKEEISLVDQAAESAPNATQPSPVPLQGCTRSNLENPLNCQNKDSGSLAARSIFHAQGDGQSINLPRSKERDRFCGSNYGRACNSKEVDVMEKPYTSTDKKKLEPVQESAKGTSSKNHSQHHEDPVTTRRSGCLRSPASQAQHTSLSKYNSDSSKGSSKLNADTQHRKEESRHKQVEERQSGRTEVSGSRSGASSSTSKNSCSEKPSSLFHRGMEKKSTREHHRKEERRQEDGMSSDKRHTKSHEMRDGEVRKTQDGAERIRSNREDKRNKSSEASKEPERQSINKNDRRATDKAKEKQVLDYREKDHQKVPENRQSASSVKPEIRKDHDKRKSSSKTEEQSYKSKVSRSSDDCRDDKSPHAHPPSDRCNDKEKSYENSKAKTDKKAKNAKRSSSHEKSRIGADHHIESAASSKQPPKQLTTNSTTSAVLEESSPKRKLSFMETLNLTLSPVKQQSNPDKAKESLQLPPSFGTNPVEDGVSFELGEEFCVIDETENSQQSVEAMDDSVPVTNGTQQVDPSSADTEHNRGQSGTPGSPRNHQYIEFNVKDLKFPRSLDGDMSETADEKSVDAKVQETEPITKAVEFPTSFFQNGPDSQCVVDEILPAIAYEPSDCSSAPLVDVFREQDQQVSVNECTGSNSSTIDDQMDIKRKPTSDQKDSSLQDVSRCVELNTSSMFCSNLPSVSLEAVSSTDTVLGVTHLDTSANLQAPSSSDTDTTKELSREKPDPLKEAESFNINTIIEEGASELAGSSKPESIQNEVKNSKPSTVVLPHDEDSMMRTLGNIKGIPEVISPITSPVRQMKKGQQQHLEKEQHVKSLSKDLSSALMTNKEATKMDMNKENKRPDSSIITSVQKDQQEPLSSAATEEELEEGEIISESEEEGALVIQSPPNDSRRSSSRIQPSPRSPRLEKTNGMNSTTPNREQQKNVTAASKDSPTSSRRRFKTVTVPPKASISTAAEFLSMFTFIRSELRRKYMKLHKNVTKTAFRCIIDMSLASFTEFIESVNFHKFCCQGNEIKSRLSKISCDIMSKLSSNGIVNRIFDQRADDLKQKLWNFVDGQFDFLFKEVKAALKRVTDLSTNKTLENKSSRPKGDLEFRKIQPKEPLSMAENRLHPVANSKVAIEGQQMIPSKSLPCRDRGLGSSGKNIKASMQEGTNVLDGLMCNQPAVVFPEKAQEPVSGYDNKTLTYSRRLSHNGLMQDRADFEILTEQQTSSLTFNLVTDSQMGEIFRCLLQGSDLLEASLSTGDNQSWPPNTPRKEGPPGENLIGVMTPSKLITPSKLVTTWASISPYKFASPNSKFQMPVNPALLDENCLLEIPSNALPIQATSALISSQQPYSILADDLAVSLTIPSPLKSDGHLSFLNHVSGQQLSTPRDVITAHYSEDAHLDGEDATEQDIHLSLDTDNSSGRSSTGGNWEAPDTLFPFKPTLPMQAEVMERSNDHFILRIRHTSPEDPKQEHEAPSESTVVCHENKSSASPTALVSGPPLVTELLTTSNAESEAQMLKEGNSFVGCTEGGSPSSFGKTIENPTKQTGTENQPPAATGATAPNETEESANETLNTCLKKHKKRKKHCSGPKAKHSRREKSQDSHEKQKRKKRSRSSVDKCERTPSKKKKSPSPQLSPNSLSAHNVVRKKGEVVVTWTREEDRDILIELKMKGATAKTFAALSTKLRKSQAQIEERFSQLMKLFKKKEKLEG